MIDTILSINEIENIIVGLRDQLSRACELYVEQATQKERESYEMWVANSRNPKYIAEAKHNYICAKNDARDIFWSEINAVVEDPGNPDDSFVGEYRRGY